MDTRNKRASALGFALAAFVVLPAPDVSVDQTDRQQVAFSYSGIQADVPPPTVIAIPDRVTVDASIRRTVTVDAQFRSVVTVEVER